MGDLINLMNNPVFIARKLLRTKFKDRQEFVSTNPEVLELLYYEVREFLIIAKNIEDPEEIVEVFASMLEASGHPNIRRK
tara:strand:- start:649 stop:888 length:240 start_codon:yes stop_codon:yes gene_type:complete